MTQPEPHSTRNTYVAMKLGSIEFIPLSTPLAHHLQTLAVAAWFALNTFGPFVGLFLSLYLLTTRLRPLILLYYLWIYLDRETCHRGGRPLRWVRALRWWRAVHAYFPYAVRLAPGHRLRARRNYVYACAPHGVYPLVVLANCSEAGEMHRAYPAAQHMLATLPALFHFPFYREFILGMGGVAVSRRSIEWALGSTAAGGRVLGIIPGGVAEAFHAGVGRYRTLIRQRKGFVRLALRHGADLVPLVTFGEDRVFDVVNWAWLAAVRGWVKRWTTFGVIVPNGRGFFQLNYGLIPRKCKVTTVVGVPIPVERVENPSDQEVDELHEKFINAMIDVFETYKSEYIEDWENTHFEI